MDYPEVVSWKERARGEDMLSFIDLAQNAFERSPTLREFVTSWIKPVLGKFKILDKRMVSRRAGNRRRQKRPQWGVVPQTCHQKKVICLGPSPCDCRCCTGRVHESHPQAHRRIPHCSNTPSLLPPVVADVVQIVLCCA